jgi:capsular exopolysaccharide synthesis family protein
MTIMEALARAKLLRQAQVKEQRASEPELPASPPPAHVPDRRAAAPAPARRPTTQFKPLSVVEVSAAACEQNRILVSDEQLRAFPQAAAAYRLLRSRIQQGLKRNKWSTIAVSSPTPDDGKTTTILNVAISIAREKQRTVCVLDLDMRNPSAFRYLGISDARPVSDYFAGEATAEDVLFQTSVPNLVVAGGLSPVDGASEMLAGPRFEELVFYIRDRWPDAIVILDLPPVTVTDEALVVAPRVDATLMVVAEGKTERKDLARALGMLNDFTVAGVIINRSSDFHVAKYDHYTV